MSELREEREREKRLMSDFNELEEENCSLQRSLAHLKQQQLAVDSLQHESVRLEEENAFWKAKADEEEHIKKGTHASAKQRFSRLWNEPIILRPHGL